MRNPDANVAAESELLRYREETSFFKDHKLTKHSPAALGAEKNQFLKTSANELGESSQTCQS